MKRSNFAINGLLIIEGSDLLLRAVNLMGFINVNRKAHVTLENYLIKEMDLLITLDMCSEYLPLHMAKLDNKENYPRSITIRPICSNSSYLNNKKQIVKEAVRTDLPKLTEEWKNSVILDINKNEPYQYDRYSFETDDFSLFVKLRIEDEKEMFTILINSYFYFALGCVVICISVIIVSIVFLVKRCKAKEAKPPPKELISYYNADSNSLAL